MGENVFVFIHIQPNIKGCKVMISNRCARKSLLINCNSIISKNYLRFLVDNNEFAYYYNAVEHGEDTAKQAVKVKHYFLRVMFSVC